MSRDAPPVRHGGRLAVVSLGLAGLLLGSGVASADTSVDRDAMTLTVSQSENLPLTGGVITVSGSGYDDHKGIYVAVCVDNGPGQTPTPCLGGVDMTGRAGASAWISSHPPDYAEGLTTPYGPGGTFSIDLAISAVDQVTGVDCTTVSCAVVTRADHTRPSDRSLDVRIPLAFSPAGRISSVPGTPASAEPTTTKAGTTKAGTTKAGTTKAGTTKAGTAKAGTTTPETTKAAITTSPSATVTSARTATASSTPTASTQPATPSSAPVQPAVAVVDSGGSDGTGWVIAGAAAVVAAAALGFWRLRRGSRKGTA